MLRVLAKHERSVCACDKCKDFCRTTPGCVAPSDVDRIAEHLGLPWANEDFFENNFEATTDGPSFTDDPNDRFPAIRPKRKPNGECIFLSSEGKCTIHPVAPYECSRSKACDPEDGLKAIKAMAKTNAGSVDQSLIWARMRVIQERQGK